MDITHLFKAGVMTVKLKRRNELSPSEKLDKTRILPKSTHARAHRDEFTRQTREVCQKITSLRNVLLENRTAYMRIGQHLKNATHMTDEQRDLIDRESEKFVVYYTQHLAQMRADWKREKRKPQQRAHMEAVFDLLTNYLHSVQHIYLEQKKYRVQHELETYRLLKLAADRKKIPVRPGVEHSELRRRHYHSDNDSSTEETNQKSALKKQHKQHDPDGDESSDIDLDDGWQLEGSDQKKLINSKPHNKQQTKKVKNRPITLQASDDKDDAAAICADYKSPLKSSQKVAVDEDIQQSQKLVEAEQEAKELKPEDIQVFEQENMQLYHELQGLSEEVELIEKNVVDIAQLQDIFTEKVSLQQHNIERIANAVIGSTENVKDANEQIKQAIQRNAGLRVWSLFFLLVMSFALLFLDWYYD